MTARPGIETRKLAIHLDLYQRLSIIRDAMQARAARPKITLQDALQELLDEYEKTSPQLRDMGVKP